MVPHQKGPLPFALAVDGHGMVKPETVGGRRGSKQGTQGAGDCGPAPAQFSSGLGLAAALGCMGPRPSMLPHLKLLMPASASPRARRGNWQYCMLAMYLQARAARALANDQ